MIRYFDYRPEYDALRDEIHAAMEAVLRSGQLILGPEVEAFERECARYLEVDDTVGVSSGTAALELALQAVGVKPGDEVITVANAGVPPVAAIRAAGATPVFADVDPATLLISPEEIERKVSLTTRAILPVHLYGQPAPLAPILEIAERRGLAVVEDCAQAFGARYRERPVGAWGDIGCTSFYPTKVLGAYGDGGLCMTGNRERVEHLRMLRMYGFRRDGHAHVEGVNSRLDELQAAILRVKLRHLGPAIEERRKIAAAYEEGLRGADCRVVSRAAEGTHVHHLFVVEVDARDEWTARLDAAGIGFGIHYPEPVHRMEAYRWLGYGPGSLPVTERACRKVLSLPIYPGMPGEDVERVIDAMRRSPVSR